MSDYKTPEVSDLTKLYINGQYTSCTSGRTLSISNPNENTLISDQIPVASEQDVDRAVDAALAAFNGVWKTFSGLQRSRVLNRLADLLEVHLELILRLDSLASGAPCSLIPTREKVFVLNVLRYYAGWCDKQAGEYFPQDDGMVKFVRNEPLGVCAAICPFNAPLGTLMFKLAPALASGNVMIVKPSEKTPLGTLALGPLFEMAGLPPGVVQIVTGGGDVGQLLAKHMKIRKLSFTGSVSTGKKVYVSGIESNLKRVTLELGGKSPAIVFADASIENAAEWSVNALMTRSGQTCIAPSRVYVHESISDTFIASYLRKMEVALEKMGNSQERSTSYGPVVDELAFQRIQECIARGEKEATLLTGGILSGPGCFIKPTVFVNPKSDAQILRDEIFGPVSVICTFQTEDEVVSKANDTEFGLMAGIFTRDINRAINVSSRLESGVVGVNCVSVMNLQVPFGGVKASGVGRELGAEAMRHYTEKKTVVINLN